MKKIKVLMLGWEFPPVINGGLGIACYGIAKALSSQVDLKVILPKSDPNFYVENTEIIGLNNLTVRNKYNNYQVVDANNNIVSQITKDEYNAIKNDYTTFSELYEVPTPGIDPYHTVADRKSTTVQTTTSHIETTKQTTTTTHTTPQYDVQIEAIDEEWEPFDIGALYGDDVNSKVIQYADYVVNLARDMDFDVIHAHDWMTMLAGLKLKWAYNKPLVVHAHALSYDRGGPNARGWVYDLEKYGMQNADAVIPVSNYTGSVVTGHYGIDSSKVFPIHNGIDPVKTFKGDKKIPEKIVLFLGRLTEQKGPEYFLDIASKVLAEEKNVRFVMAGTGDKMKRLIEAGAYKQVGNKFHFTGFLNRDKVNQLLSIADVYCMPSVSEPFGLSAMEAAQFGIPAVISKQSGVSEVLPNALKADFWDVELMSEHILKLVRDEEFAAEVVAKTNKDIEAITWPSCTKKITDIYNQLLA